MVNSITRALQAIHSHLYPGDRGTVADTGSGPIVGSADGPEIWVSARRLGSDDWRVIGCNRPEHGPLLVYSSRWRVECLFSHSRQHAPHARAGAMGAKTEG